MPSSLLTTTWSWIRSRVPIRVVHPVAAGGQLPHFQVRVRASWILSLALHLGAFAAFNTLSTESKLLEQNPLDVMVLRASDILSAPGGVSAQGGVAAAGGRASQQQAPSKPRSSGVAEKKEAARAKKDEPKTDPVKPLVRRIRAVALPRPIVKPEPEKRPEPSVEPSPLEPKPPEVDTAEANPPEPVEPTPAPVGAAPEAEAAAAGAAPGENREGEAGSGSAEGGGAPGGAIGGSGGDLVPIFQPDPDYPRAALAAGREGLVEVIFTILPDGTTRDVRVGDAQPPGVFDRAAVRAVSRWKYASAGEGGVLTERPDVRVVIEFKVKGRRAPASRF